VWENQIRYLSQERYRITSINKSMIVCKGKVHDGSYHNFVVDNHSYKFTKDGTKP